ncbi:unnamed protein product [Rotaria sp. Silwood1]|nr:unnamed protein product [Rotaria sp. Silwood1]
MAVEGIKTAQKANVSISVSAFLLTEQGRPKTSIASYSFSKERSATTDTRRLIDNGQYPIDIIQRLSSSTCRIIPNWEKAAHHIIFSTQTNNGNHQRSLSSKRNISTQTIIGDVRQPALLEAYQPLVTTDTIVQRSHNHKRRREKKKADEIKQVVNKDPSPSTIVTTDIPSINRHPFNCEFIRQRQAAIDNMAYQQNIISWRATSLYDVISLIKNLSMGKNVIDLV